MEAKKPISYTLPLYTLPLRLLVFVLLVITGFSSRLFAQPVPPSPYRVDQFTTDEGLPGHQIYDIEQTADGFLWVATNAGLARFDGHGFTVFNSQNTSLPYDQVVTKFYLSQSDTLFMTLSGGEVFSYTDGSFAHYASMARLSGRVAQSILPLVYARPLFVDGSGDTWLVIKNDRLPAAAQNPFDDTYRCVAYPEAQSVLARLEQEEPVSQGATLYPYLITNATRGEVLFAKKRGTTVEFFNPQGHVHGRYRLPHEACPRLIDRDGYLWTSESNLNEDSPLHIYAPGEPVPVASLVLPAGGITRQFEDREGNLWIGASTQGLFRVRKNPFQVYAAPHGLEPENVVTLVQGRAGSVLVVVQGHVVYRIEGQRATQLIDKVMGIYEDSQGQQLYVKLLPTSIGLFRLNAGQEQFLGETGGASLYQQIYADPQESGMFWLSDTQSVYRLIDPMGTAPTLTTVLDGLTDVRQLFKDRAGILWVATHGGLYRHDGSQTTHFTMEDGLPDNRVRAIHEDEDGVLWLGTYGGGLARYKDGRFQTINEAHGLADNIVSTILEDEAGYFWMSSDRGVHRTNRAELNALLNGSQDQIDAILYSRESGLLNPEASGLPALNADDGRLWFPTFEGAAVVDPVAALKMDQAPPIVHVEDVLIDNVPIKQEGGIHLDAEQRRFEIAYVGLSLRNPEGVHYRYKLEGFDEDWIEAGTARRATYTNVTPGTHIFRVQARNFGGIWSEQDGLLTLNVAPFFFETSWFYLLCAITMLGLVYGGYRVRIRQSKAREEALSKLVKERTQALADEKETVAAQAEKLRSLDKAKSRFFANISHEFRTPLTLILGPLEDLQDGLHGDLSNSGARHVNTAIRNGRRLLRLVNQLLDVSRLESGKIELQAQELDLVEFVERLGQAFVPMAEHKRVDFRVELPGGPLLVYFDPEQFEKVLANLLGNAFKFTPEDGVVLVTLSEDATGGQVVLSVRDNGPGVAPEHLPHLFERFYQADASSTRRQPGTGIGLALVKNLVELHHGTIEVESHVGLGTTFTVRLLLGHVHLNPSEIVSPDLDGLNLELALGDDVSVVLTDEIRVEPEEVVEALASEVVSGVTEDVTTVLVVDDNPDVRAYVRRHLTQRYRVLEAANGRQALDLARDSLPDLVVSDVMMPEMNGFGLCRAIKQDPALDFIPVILLTAKASSESKIEGLEEGADDYLTKPFNVRELEARVENLIALRQRLKARYANTQNRSVLGQVSPTQASMRGGEVGFIERVRAEIEARLSEDDFGVDALATAVGLGRTTLYARIGEAFGETPMDLIWQMRLERAASLLRQQRGSVSEVAYGVGFKSVAHFSNRFRSQYGLSPTTYMAQHFSDSA